MAIFIKPETRSSMFTDEEQQALITMLPGFQGLDERSHKGIEAIKNSDIFTAINMIASDIATLELETFVDGLVSEGDSFPILFNVRPNEFYTGYMFKYIMVANSLLNGESFAEIVRDARGNVVALYHLSNSKVTYKQDKSTSFKLVYEFYETPDKKRRILSDDIIHLKFFSLDGIKGESPLISLGDDMSTQTNSKRFLSNFFKNGTNAGGMLKIKGAKLSKEARDVLRDEWQKANSGSDKAHKVLVMDETMDYEAMEIDTEILKLINTSTHSTTQVAKVFGIPRHRFGLETANMSLEQMNLDYLINTLSPYLESFVSELRMKLVPQEEMSRRLYRFNTEEYKTIDAETKAKNTKMKLETGIINIDGARKEYGLPPLANGLGTKHLVSLNFTTVDNLEEYQMKKADSLPVPKGGE